MKSYKKIILRVLVLLGTSSALYAYNPEDLATLIQTGNCQKCDLTLIANLTTYIEAIKKQGGTNLQATLDIRINLEGSDLSQSNLSFAPLQNCNLSNVTAIGTDFSRALMFGCNLSGSNVEGANFEDTDLRNAQLDNVTGLASRNATHGHSEGLQGILRTIFNWLE